MLSNVFLYLIYLVLSLSVNIMAMLAIKFDCESEGIKNKTGWMVFAFFLPILCAIIYFIKRKKLKRETPKYCSACGTTNDSDAKFCIQCGNVYLENYKVVGGEEKKKKAKIFLIVAICLFVASNIFNSFIDTDELLYDSFGDSFSDIYDYDDEYFDDYDIYDYDDESVYDENYFGDFEA